MPVNTINSEPMPDEANTQFATAVSARIARSVGVKSHEIALDASVRQTLATFVTAFFWRELGLARAPKLPGDTFIHGDENSTAVSLTVDPDALTRALEHVAIAQPTELCKASANIETLVLVLNLEPVEKKLLAWSFAAAHSAHAEPFVQLAYELRFSDVGHTHHVLSVLLDESVDDVKNMFVSGRLLALGLFTPSSWNRAANLNDVLSASCNALSLLLTPHRSHNALLVYLLEPELDWMLLVDLSTPSSVFRQCFPERIAAVYERTVQQQSLRASDIAALLYWFAAIDVPGERLETLAGRLDFEVVRETVKRCVVERSQLGTSATEFDLMRSLYNAAA